VVPGLSSPACTAAVIRSSGIVIIVLPQALANDPQTRQTAPLTERHNMRLIAVLLIISSLTACSVARNAVGVISNIGSKTESVQNAEASAAAAEATSVARGITRADDMGQISKQLPGGLVGDTKNSLHSGDPIPPQ
jgi:hypothetical protein